MILPIYIYGMPVLRKVAQDITLDYPGLDSLIGHRTCCPADWKGH